MSLDPRFTRLALEPVRPAGLDVQAGNIIPIKLKVYNSIGKIPQAIVETRSHMAQQYLQGFFDQTPPENVLEKLFAIKLVCI